MPSELSRPSPLLLESSSLCLFACKGAQAPPQFSVSTPLTICQAPPSLRGWVAEWLKAPRHETADARPMPSHNLSCIEEAKRAVPHQYIDPRRPQSVHAPGSVKTSSTIGSSRPTANGSQM